MASGRGEEILGRNKVMIMYQGGNEIFIIERGMV